MPGMYVIDEILAVLNERAASSITPSKITPVRCVKILANIKAGRSKMGIENFKGVDLLLHDMSAIVNDNVKTGQLLYQPVKEVPVSLVSNKNRSLFVFKVLAVRIDVDAKEFGRWSKVVFPHLEGTTVRHTYLQDMNICSSPLREITIVNIEIMGPLVDEIARVVVEVALKVIHTRETIRFRIVGVIVNYLSDPRWYY